MSDTPWYQSAFGDHYTDLYGHRDQHDAQRAIDFLSTRPDLAPAAGPILDLCCGSGRHSAELLSRAPADIVSLDLSPNLLRDASALAQESGLPLCLVRGDMCHLPFPDRSFRLVLNLFTSFGYFFDERENEGVLAEVARVLRDRDSRLVLDHINPPWLRGHLQPETQRTTSGGATVRESRRIDEERQRVEKRIEWTRDGRTRTFLESVRLYEPGEMEALAARAGLRLLALYGGFDASPHTPASPRSLYVFAAQ